MPVDDALSRFADDGFALVPGLIAPEVVSRAGEALCRRLDIRLDQPETWKDAAARIGEFAWAEDPEVLACYTPEMLAVVGRLAGEPPTAPLPPDFWFSIIVFPSVGDWSWPRWPHIDHSKKEDNHPSDPPAFRIGAIVYLDDVPSRCGATVVWPGSHRVVAAMVRDRPDRYAYRWMLVEDIFTTDFGQPREVPAKAGDVLFYHHFLVHSGSHNAGPRPRLAIGHKW